MIRDIYAWIELQIETNQFFGAAAFGSAAAALIAILKGVPSKNMEIYSFQICL
jgi:hypothetical protein